MAEKSLTFKLYGRDQTASATMNRLGEVVQKNAASMIRKAAEISAAYLGIHAVVDFAKDSVEAAEAGTLAQAKLQQAVKNSGFKFADYSKQIDDTSSRMVDLGFKNADTRNALATLTTSLKDPSKAMQVLGVAADLARAKNLDLTAASLMVAKGMEGQIRPLKALGIDMNVTAGGAAQVAKAQAAVAKAQDAVNKVLAKYPSAARAGAKGNDEYTSAVKNLTSAQAALNAKQDTGQQILDELTKRLSGQASAAADTAAGHMAAYEAKVDEAKEKIGNELIKVLGELAMKLEGPVTDALDGFSKWFNGSGGQGIINVITWMGHDGKDLFSDLTGGILIATGAMWGFDAAMDANPVGATIAALVALAGYLTILTTHFDDVTAANKAMMKGIGDFAYTIEGGVATVVDGITNSIIDGLNALIRAINPILAALNIPPLKVIGHVNVAAGIAALKKAADSSFGPAPKAVVGPGQKSAGKGAIALAEGGIVRSRIGGTLARVAEAGHDEAVIPLTQKNLSMLGGGGGNHYHLYGIQDPQAFAYAVDRRQSLRRA